MTDPFCRPRCALACPTTGWGWVLDDTSATPPAWRVAWTLVGTPHPLPESEWKPMLLAAADAYGLPVVRRGLRLAADVPPTSGWTPDARGRVVALLDALEVEEVAR